MLGRVIQLPPPDLPCGDCGHLRSTHFRDAQSCLHSTDSELWACGCGEWVPERDPAWADVYARIAPTRSGWIVEFRIDSSRSFFHIVEWHHVERSYLGWPGVLDSFVRAADHLLSSTQDA